MRGRVRRLPVDVMFKSALREGGNVSYPKYVDDKKDLNEVMVFVEKHKTQMMSKSIEPRCTTII